MKKTSTNPPFIDKGTQKKFEKKSNLRQIENILNKRRLDFNQHTHNKVIYSTILD